MESARTIRDVRAAALGGRFEFPLFERELADVWRKSRSSWPRLALMAAFALMLLVNLIFAGTAAFNDLLQRALTFVVYVQGAAVAVTVLFSASMIAREQEERTFPLLLVAGFRPSDMYWSKFAGLAYAIAWIVLLPMPMVGMAVGLGAPMTVHVLPLAAIALFGLAACALGLCVSTVCGTPSAAMAVYLALMGAWVVVAGWLPLPAGWNPVVFHGALAAVFPAPLSLRDWWLLAAVHGTLIIGSSSIALLVMPMRVYPREAKRRTWVRRRYRPGWGNAAVRYAQVRATGVADFLRHPAAGLGFMIFASVLAVWSPLMWLLFLVAFCYDVASSASRAVRDGVLLDMLLMPIGDRQAGAYLLIAYFRHTWMYAGPLIAGVTAIVWYSPELILWTDRLGATMVPTEFRDAYARLVAVTLACIWIPGAVLSSTNVCVQGKSVFAGTLIGAAVYIECMFVSALVINTGMLMLASPAWAPMQLTWFVTTGSGLSVFLLFWFWYYRLYCDNLRDALFEDSKRKAKNV